MTERRTPALKPEIHWNMQSITNYFSALDSYINDKFSLRADLIQVYSLIQYNIGVSIKPGKAIIGKNGYFFAGNNLNKVIDQITGKNLFTEEELKEWNTGFLQRQAYLNQMGIQMYVLIAPNKHSIYPEYLPKFIIPSENNRLEQILNSTPELNLISPKDTLIKAKMHWHNLLYRKNDTHWSGIGAYIAYLDIIKSLSSDFDDLKPINLNDENLSLMPEKGGGDVLRQLYLESVDGFRIQIIKNKEWINDLVKTNYLGDTLPFNSLDSLGLKEQAIIINTQKPYTILLLKDSFTTWLSPYLNQTFGKIIYCHYNQVEGIELTQLVEKYKPDIVLYEFAERMLINKQEVHPNVKLKLGKYNFKTLKELNGEQLFEQLIPRKHITNQKVENTDFHFRSIGNDPILILPAIKLSQIKRVAVKIDLTVPEESILQLFYRTINNKNFNRENSLRIRVSKGRDIFTFLLPEIVSSGKALRFDPGITPGNYIIHSIEFLEEE